MGTGLTASGGRWFHGADRFDVASALTVVHPNPTVLFQKLESFPRRTPADQYNLCRNFNARGSNRPAFVASAVLSGRQRCSSAEEQTHRSTDLHETHARRSCTFGKIGRMRAGGVIFPGRYFFLSGWLGPIICAGGTRYPSHRIGA